MLTRLVAINILLFISSGAHAETGGDFNVTGGPMVLWCSTDQTPPVTIHWYWNKQNITNDIKVADNGTNSTYSKDAASVHDAGEYFCSVTAAVTVNQTISVNAAPVPRRLDKFGLHEKDDQKGVWVQSSAEYTVIEGSPLTLRCSFYGYPKPHIRWYNHSNEITASNTSTRVQVEDGKLVIERAESWDRGTYKCRAKNMMGMVEVEMFVRVRSMWAPLWPVIGIIVEIVVLIVTILAFEWYEKNKQKDDTPKDDD